MTEPTKPTPPEPPKADAAPTPVPPEKPKKVEEIGGPPGPRLRTAVDAVGGNPGLLAGLLDLVGDDLLENPADGTVDTSRSTEELTVDLGRAAAGRRRSAMALFYSIPHAHASPAGKKAAFLREV